MGPVDAVTIETVAGQMAGQMAGKPAARKIAADPLGSPLWAMHAARLFADAPVVFDPAVRVEMPQIAENQHVFPVLIDARAISGVQRIVVLADLNPIPVAVDFAPGRAAPWLALRIKLDQRTPVRAAVLGGDGRWHVAGGWIDAAGGGCSAPPVSRARGDWAEHLGELRGAAFASPEGTRLRFTVRHPMDTGLVENIPAYTIETITLASAGQELARMTVSGAVAEDPAFSLLLPAQTGPVTLALRDTSGLEFIGQVSPPVVP